MMAYHLLPMVAWQASASCVLVLVYIPQPRHIILLVGFCCLCLSIASKAVHWSISILFNRSDTAGFGGKSDFLRFSLFCLPFRRFWELYQSENSTGIYTFSAFRTRRVLGKILKIANMAWQVFEVWPISFSRSDSDPPSREKLYLHHSSRVIAAIYPPKGAGTGGQQPPSILAVSNELFLSKCLYWRINISQNQLRTYIYGQQLC